MSLLKFVLDVDAKLGALPALQRTITSIERTLLRLDPQLKRTMAAANAFGTSVGFAIRGVLGLTRGMARLAGFSFGKVGSFFKDIASTALGYASVQGIEAISMGLLHLTETMITTASGAERTHRAFKALFGATGGPALEGQIETFAKHTAVDDDVFKNIIGGLKQAGLPDIDKNWRQIAQTIGDLAALDLGKGTQTEKIEAFGEAFENLAKRGQVSSRMLSALNISQKEFWKTLADDLGMGVDETKKQAAKGKIAIGDIVHETGNLLYKHTGKPVGTFEFQVGADPDSALNRVKRIPDELFKNLAGSEAMGKLAAGLDRIAAAFDPSTAQGKRITEGLERMVGGFAKALQDIDVDKLSTTLVDLFTKLPGLIDSTTRAALALLSVVSKLGGGHKDTTAAPVAPPKSIYGLKPTMDDRTPAQKLIDSSSSSMVTDMLKRAPKGAFTPIDLPTRRIKETPEQSAGTAAFRYALHHPIEVLKNLGHPDRLGQKAADEYKTYLDQFESGSQGAQGLADGLASKATEVTSAGGKLGDAAATGTRQSLDSHSPSRVYRQIGEDSREGFEIGLAASVPAPIPAPVPAPSRAVEGGTRSMGAMSVTVPITLNYSGGAGEDAGRELSDRLADILPSQLQAAFEAMRLEMGMA